MTEQLSPENKKYYDQLVDYIGSAIGTETDATSDTLADIKADLLQAQASGQSAREFFGDDPEAIAKQIVANLPRQPLKISLRIAAIGFFALFLLLFLTNLYIGGRRQPVGSELALTLGLLVIVSFAVDQMRRRAFKARWQVWLTRIGLGLLVGLTVTGYGALPEFGFVTFSGTGLEILSGVLVAAAIVYFVWLGKTDPWPVTLLAALTIMFLSVVGLREAIHVPEWQLYVSSALISGIVVRTLLWARWHPASRKN